MNTNNNTIKDESLYTENYFSRTGKQRNQYQYQQQTQDPEKVYRGTMLGQALILSLHNLKQKGIIPDKGDFSEQIMSKFDKIYSDQFDQIPALGSENKPNGYDASSLSQSMVHENESSLVSQLTAQNSHNSFNSVTQNQSGAGSYFQYQNNMKLNLNKNKITGTCRDYKHLDDEWKFNVDSLSVVEATSGNVFHDPNPPVYGVKQMAETQI